MDEKQERRTLFFFSKKRERSQPELKNKGDKHRSDSNEDQKDPPNNLPTRKQRPSHQAPLGNGSQHTSASILDFVPLPMPLPAGAHQHAETQENPSAYPGAYALSGGRRIGTRHRLNPELTEQVRSLDDSDLTEAWPVSEPTSRAVPYQGALENHGHRTRLGKLFFAGIVAIVTAILASSAARILLIPTSDPNKIQHLQIKSTIMDAYGEEYFNNKQKEKALHWIIYEDPRNSFGIEEKGQPINLIQRFSMVACYFQTSSQNPWTFCNPRVDQQSDTCFHKTDPSQSNGAIGTRWLTAAHECQWMGVFCAGGDQCVTGLTINRNNMSGTFPEEELAKLTQLKELDLEKNKLTGSLPENIFKDNLYKVINLNENKLTGRVPFQDFMTPSFTGIGLRGNQVTGSIPTQIGLIKGTDVWLDLSINLLTGSVPEDIHAATELRDVILDQNLLTGTLPPTLGLLSQMESFSASGNPMHGSIPSQLGLIHLTHLALERSYISGTIPEELYLSKNLIDMWLSNCNLTGTISTRIGQMKKLQLLRVANNNLYGTIPKEMFFAESKLTSLQLQGNSFLTGSIPDLFCSQVHQGIIVAADCTPNAATGVPSVYCPKHCCSMCCDVETNVCLEQ